MMTKRVKFKRSTIKNVKFIDSELLYKRFVNPKSILVRIHDEVDFSFVNQMCEGLYSPDGQYPYLPELVFKVTFIQYLKNGLSDNEVVRQCTTNLEYRYFCDLAIDDELFDDCKLCRFRKELGPKKFKEIFDRVVDAIKERGLISNTDVLYLDSFLFLADVKIVSVNSLLSKAIQHVLRDAGLKDAEMEEDAEKRDFELSEELQKTRFVFLVQKAQKLLKKFSDKKDFSVAAKKSLDVLARIVKERSDTSAEGEVRKKSGEEEKDKVISVADPDARMMGKNDRDIHPSYKAHVAMNPNGFITNTDVTLATVYDGHHASLLIRDLKKKGYKVPACVGDTHYGDILLRQQMADEQTQVIAPYRKNQVMNSCLTEEVMIFAWAYNHTNEYKEHHRIRSHIEPKQGEMKNLHGMKRAHYQNLPNIQIQNLMSAIVTNTKHLIQTLDKKQ